MYQQRSYFVRRKRFHVNKIYYFVEDQLISPTGMLGGWLTIIGIFDDVNRLNLA